MAEWTVDDNGVSEWRGPVRTLFLTEDGSTQLLCVDYPVNLAEGSIVKITTLAESGKGHRNYRVTSVEFESFHGGAGPFVMVYLREAGDANLIV